MACPRARKAFIARQPMGRLAQAHEIAPLVVFLASDEAAFVTGGLFNLLGPKHTSGFALIAAIGMVASILGSFFVKAGDSAEVHALSKALHRGTNIAMGITVVFQLALMLIELFSVRLNVLPLFGMFSDQHESMTAGARLAELVERRLHALVQPCILDR